MILGWLRLAFFLYLGLTVAYVLTGIYMRSVKREALENAWDSDPAREGQARDERDAFIAAGIEAYRHGLKRRLRWLIFILPTVGFALTIYYVNWS